MNDEIQQAQQAQQNQAPDPKQKSACEGPGDEAWDIYEAMFD
jgi:hypothetical protein